jgi:hypothetical protein
MSTNIVPDRDLIRQVSGVLQKSISYCQANEWSGYDPYDALNSPVFEKWPFSSSRVLRIAVTQLFRRSPANLRSAFAVPKTQNAKALALFLSTFAILDAAGEQEYRPQADHLIERLKELRSHDPLYWSWGYSFPWQTRTVLVPSRTPNLVCTVFVAAALLDAYERYGIRECLELSASAAEYIIDKLYWYEGESVAGFAYPLPTVHNQVHNANLLAAALLCRISRYTEERKFLVPALRAARFSVSRQKEDGAWHYGEGPSQSFIDNFHTGFNLCALHTMKHQLRSDEFSINIDRGFRYYRDHFYLKSGGVRYFHDKTYPIDMHAVAQSIITPTVLSDGVQSYLDMASSVFEWAIEYMWDKDGYFYYRMLRTGTIRIPYMRWSEAWMVLAIAHLLGALRKTQKHRPCDLISGSI